MPPRVVLDTNVLVAGLRSRLGASHRVLRLAGTGRFEHGADRFGVAVITPPQFLRRVEADR